ncbi:phosphoribosyl-ATP diphosphatase [Oligella urethralis]|uniref:Phosphoribosyl-ATP pyrophosphatase n=1 Tax=Oligella urethralis DNF00040 TaxID=1401065 RepID=A0A095Z767_9BURK|nr:phosphoribosyl-ATP diphosphatase [Oligella urethralis]KGF30575.1 phosphoribosyl-ATP pyrophosphatase [Oligella urethralis DNF00040]
MSEQKQIEAQQVLAHLEQVLISRLPANGGDPDTSYVAKLYHKGENSFLKKIAEEGAELIMACKDGNQEEIIYEAADLWFHSLLALIYYGVSPAQVLAELARREGLSGLVEKTSRPE